MYLVTSEILMEPDRHHIYSFTCVCVCVFVCLCLGSDEGVGLENIIKRWDNFVKIRAENMKTKCEMKRETVRER